MPVGSHCGSSGGLHLVFKRLEHHLFIILVTARTILCGLKLSCVEWYDPVNECV